MTETNHTNLGGELASIGFTNSENKPHLYTKSKDGKTYGVDENKPEAFYLDDLTRITDDPEDEYLQTLWMAVKRYGGGNKKEPEKEYEVEKRTEKETEITPSSNVPEVTKQQLPEKKVFEITMDDIRNYICPEATEKEAYMFLKLCQSRNLNPFANEAYLIKYPGSREATTVVGKDAFTRRAEEHPQFDGFEAGIILQYNDTIEKRMGTFKLPEETIVGGWAKVYRKDRVVPYVNEVTYSEYEGKKKDGTVTKMWKTKPGTMIRKVALVQSLREAFPSEFGGCYDSCEMGVDL
jgi:phage recombination protein Bet